MTRIGCLLSLAAAAALVFVGIQVGGVFVRFYTLQDAMKQEVRFAQDRSDREIRVRIAAKADSLGLPAAASVVRITRNQSGIAIWSEYVDTIAIAGYVRGIPRRPSAERTF